MTHHDVLETIKREKLVAILRGVPMERLEGVVGALVRGGVRILEFTFDHDKPERVQENAAKIHRAVELYGDSVLVGCGTALTVQDVEAACDAGACLVISPNVDLGVIRRTRQLGMVSMPGALTPTEIVAAYQAGADIVKLFPAGELGLGYIKAVRGPLGLYPHERGGRREARKREGIPRCGRVRIRRGRSARALFRR